MTVKILSFFGGAGVSTESNIPDFRSADGLYQQKYKYSPEQIVSHTFFKRNTEGFYEFYKEKMMFLDAKPNAAHKKLAGLEQAGKLKQSLRRILTDFIRQQEVRMYMRSMEAFIAITVKNAENSTMQHM